MMTGADSQGAGSVLGAPETLGPTRLETKVLKSCIDCTSRPSIQGHDDFRLFFSSRFMPLAILTLTARRRLAQIAIGPLIMADKMATYSPSDAKVLSVEPMVCLYIDAFRARSLSLSFENG